MTVYEIQHIPGKGRGLVARVNIPRGTRIVAEAPLFTLQNMPEVLIKREIATKLEALTGEQQRQFLSLHNNFPGENAFSGIFRTNAFRCGPDFGAVYYTICLINHDCRPNAHNKWNPESEQQTIHATADILSGEEISICYLSKDTSTSVRQRELKQSFGFDCSCSLCSSPPQRLQESDTRRTEIQRLDATIGDTMMSFPAISLENCKDRLCLLEEEYGETGSALHARTYSDAFQICIAHADQARAAVFAEYAYKARIVCEGEDSPETKRMGMLMREPSAHPSYAVYSKSWKSERGAKSHGLGRMKFEKWLWHE